MSDLNRPEDQPNDTGDVDEPTEVPDPEAADPDDIVRDASGNPDAEPGLGRVPMPPD